jgi:hypothetical protein
MATERRCSKQETMEDLVREQYERDRQNLRWLQNRVGNITIRDAVE